MAYKVTETVPKVWGNPEIECVSFGDLAEPSQFTYGQIHVVIDLVYSDIVHCTFTNTPSAEAPAAPFVPEASTLLLLGGAATSLAGYVGLQIRARHRK